MRRINNSHRSKNKIRLSSKYYNKFVKQNRIFTILQIVFLISFIISLTQIIKWCKLNEHTEEEKRLANSAIVYETGNKNANGKYSSIDFKKLKEKNDDTVAWIRVNGTNIEYPIVKTNNNDYYLYHSFDKTKSNAGWVFMDYRNKLDGTDKNIIIYGHNRKDGSIFGSLKNILKETWYDEKDNLEIEFWTENGKEKYQVFSIYEIENEDYYLSTTFDNYDEYLNKIKNRSIKDFGINLSNESNILTLSTCSSTNKRRIVLHAVNIAGINNTNDKKSDVSNTSTSSNNKNGDTQTGLSAYKSIWQYPDSSYSEKEFRVNNINDSKVNFDFIVEEITTFENASANITKNIAKFDIKNEGDWNIKGTITFNDNKVVFDITESSSENIPTGSTTFTVKSNKNAF